MKDDGRRRSVLRRSAIVVAVVLLTLFEFRDGDHGARAPAFAFESSAVGTSSPTRWPACSTIPYVVNLRRAPSNAAAVLARATRIVHSITGLAFVAVGTTTQTNFASYDESGAVVPVVFAWLGPDELLGATNVNAITVPIVNATRTRYTSGFILFDDNTNQAFLRNSAFATNLILHELGHVLGLADVNNTSEVMNDWLGTGTKITTYQKGDLVGLRVLYGAPPHRRRSLRRRPLAGRLPAECARGTEKLLAESQSTIAAKLDPEIVTSIRTKSVRRLVF